LKLEKGWGHIVGAMFTHRIVSQKGDCYRNCGFGSEYQRIDAPGSANLIRNLPISPDASINKRHALNGSRWIGHWIAACGVHILLSFSILIIPS
jgi:hypothetical protein